MRPTHAIASHSKQVLILRNPNAGAGNGGRQTAALVEALAARGLVPREFTEVTEFSEHVEAAQSQGDLRAVVSAGGDGTAALVARTIPQGVPMVLLPLGTENLLSDYLEHRANADQAAQLMFDGVCVHLDAGRANGRLFLLMLGCGFDAEVVHRVHERRTGNIRRLAYVKPILAAIRSYQYPELRLYCESPGGDRRQWSGRWVFVVNLPRYARGLRFVPHASGADGLLDVCTFQAGSLWHGLRYLFGVWTGRHTRWPDVRLEAVRKVRIEADAPVVYQLDGDPGGSLPVDVEVVPRRLTAIVSRDWSRRHGFAEPTVAVEEMSAGGTLSTQEGERGIDAETC